MISRLSKGAIYFSDLDFILGDILALSVCFNSLLSGRMSKGMAIGNILAHRLARIIPFGVEQVWEKSP